MGNFLYELSCFSCKNCGIEGSLILSKKASINKNPEILNPDTSDNKGTESGNGDNLFIGENSSDYMSVINEKEVHSAEVISSDKI
jgi:hypothetical protein